MLDILRSDVAKYYDSVANTYDRNFTNRVDLAENRVISQKIQPIVDKMGPVVDFGCGTGLFLDYCTVPEYMGIDISPGMIENATSKHPTRCFRVTDMTIPKLLIPQDYGVAVSLFGSISYCEFPQDVLNNMRDALFPGGKVVVMALSPLYMRRKGDILSRTCFVECASGVPYKRFKRMFEDAFTLIDSFGFSCLLNYSPLFKYVPVSLLSQYLKFEARTWGRFFPDSCLFHVFIGERK